MTDRFAQGELCNRGGGCCQGPGWSSCGRQALPSEFRQHAEQRGTLKGSRDKVVLADFRRACREKDHATIVRVGRRPPLRVLGADHLC